MHCECEGRIESDNIIPMSNVRLFISAVTTKKEINLMKRELSEISLTSRERECLRWTSKGKTAWEIGVILGISQSTVVTHLNNGRAKFGVYSKHEAVIHAMNMGLIH
jgi:DNA-binding CsgD family transcriptional regulator